MRESEQGRRDVDAAIVARLPDGCTSCRGDEGIRYHWQDKWTRHVPRAPKPQVETCAVCGRTYPLKYMVVGWGSGAAS